VSGSGPGFGVGGGTGFSGGTGFGVSGGTGSGTGSVIALFLSERTALAREAFPNLRRFTGDGGNHAELPKRVA
jgi:hypothetical protein